MLLHKTWYGLGSAGKERRVMVALLQDFLRAVGLTEELEGASVFSICISCLSVSGCASPASVACMVGDGGSRRGDLCVGAVLLGLVEEHLFDDGVGELTSVFRD